MFQNEIQADNGELNDRQKVKIVSTLSEFVWLNYTLKPTQAKYAKAQNTLGSYSTKTGESQKRKTLR